MPVGMHHMRALMFRSPWTALHTIHSPPLFSTPPAPFSTWLSIFSAARTCSNEATPLLALGRFQRCVPPSALLLSHPRRVPLVDGLFILWRTQMAYLLISLKAQKKK